MARRLAWHHEWHGAIRAAALDATEEAIVQARLDALQDMPVRVTVTVEGADDGERQDW